MKKISMKIVCIIIYIYLTIQVQLNSFNIELLTNKSLGSNVGSTYWRWLSSKQCGLPLCMSYQIVISIKYNLKKNSS